MSYEFIVTGAGEVINKLTRLGEMYEAVDRARVEMIRSKSEYAMREYQRRKQEAEEYRKTLPKPRLAYSRDPAAVMREIRGKDAA